jgi:spore coat-associated protein N
VRPWLPLAAGGIALAALLPPAPDRGLELSASGALRIANSRDGEAVLSAADMRPGDQVSGSVTVLNRGTAPAHLRLHSSPPRGRLGEVLRMTIAGREGTLAELAGCRDLGTVGSGQSRTYRFTARLPRTAGNPYARASVSADERWVAGSGCSPPRVAISHRRVRLAGRSALLRVRCSGPCAGSATLAPRSWRSRRIFVARAVPFTRAGTIRVPVPPESRALLERRGKAVAVATLRGTWGARRRLVTLIAPAR